MNLALWVAQVVLALAFVAAGLLKVLQTRPQLVAKKLAWASDFSDGQVKLLGLAEVLGAVGVIAPTATRILPILTPIAAIALGLLMVGATRTHLQRKESAAPAIVLLALCLFVAVGRFRVLG